MMAHGRLVTQAVYKNKLIGFGPEFEFENEFYSTRIANINIT